MIFTVAYRNMPNFKAVLVAIISFFLFGCAASGPKFNGLESLKFDSSEIVVYRPDRFARGGVKYLLHLDGREAASLQNAGFTTISASPGKHEIEIHASAFHNFKPMKVSVNAKPGARAFLRFEPSSGGPPVVLPTAIYIPVAFDFEEIPEAQALIELQDLRRSE